MGKQKSALDIFLEGLENKEDMNEGIGDSISQKINSFFKNIFNSDAVQKFLYNTTEEEMRQQLKSFDDAFIATLALSDPNKKGFPFNRGGMQKKQILAAQEELLQRMKDRGIKSIGD